MVFQREPQFVGRYFGSGTGFVKLISRKSNSLLTGILEVGQLSTIATKHSEKEVKEATEQNK